MSGAWTLYTNDWVRNTGDAAFSAINAGETTNIRGIDLFTEWFPNEALLARVKISYTRLDIDHDRVYDESKYMFDYLRDRVVLDLANTSGRRDYGGPVGLRISH